MHNAMDCISPCSSPEFLSPELPMTLTGILQSRMSWRWTKERVTLDVTQTTFFAFVILLVKVGRGGEKGGGGGGRAALFCAIKQAIGKHLHGLHLPVSALLYCLL